MQSHVMAAHSLEADRVWMSYIIVLKASGYTVTCFSGYLLACMLSEGISSTQLWHCRDTSCMPFYCFVWVTAQAGCK